MAAESHRKCNLLCRKQVETRTALGKTKIYDSMAEGTFPRPVRVGPRAVRWVEEDVDLWIADKISKKQLKLGDTGVPPNPPASPTLSEELQASGRRPRAGRKGGRQ
jgi:prophage regulatory protein